MKQNYKLFFKTFLISLACCALFVGIGYFYLDSKLNKPAKVEIKNEPYAYTPQSKGLLFDILGDKTLFYLDFEEKCVTVIMSDIEDETESVYGYSIDYIINSDYELLSGIIDIIGGIELESDGQNLVYTGVQAVDILVTAPDSYGLKKEIIEKILYKISQNGFYRQDFLYITENSETNLTVPDFYYWQDSMSEICKTVRILD